jgi:organic hydroperoxide reductase OsmC/OhrA
MTITDDARVQDAIALHAKAHEMCFLARSMNFPVTHEPVITVAAFHPRVGA